MKTIHPDFATVIDVRTPEEFSEGHYPGAINLPLNEIIYNVEEIREMKKPVLLYCRSGNRSLMAVHILKQSGLDEVFDGGGIDQLYKLKNENA